MIDYDMGEESQRGGDAGTRYQLTGIVVHSGQASGGHYYSYISRGAKWCVSFHFCSGAYSLEHPYSHS